MAEKEFEVGDKFVRYRGRFAKVEPIMRKIGMFMVEQAHNAFINQRLGQTRWKARGVPNVYGLISDFKSGRNPPKRRFQPRPALRDTGALMRSITFQVNGRRVKVGSNLPYAKTMNDGGMVQSDVITPTVQKRLRAFLKQKANQKYKAALGHLLSPKMKGKRKTGFVEARPFLGVTAKSKKLIKKHIVDVFKEIN